MQVITRHRSGLIVRSSRLGSISMMIASHTLFMEPVNILYNRLRMYHIPDLCPIRLSVSHALVVHQDRLSHIPVAHHTAGLHCIHSNYSLEKVFNQRLRQRHHSQIPSSPLTDRLRSLHSLHSLYSLCNLYSLYSLHSLHSLHSQCIQHHRF